MITWNLIHSTLISTFGCLFCLNKFGRLKTMLYIYCMEKQNILIAEFMGARFRHLVNIKLKQYSFNHKTDGNWKSINDLSYNTSWDWLMPVVNKIETLGYLVNICDCICTIAYDKHPTTGAGNKLNATYLAVVKFIEWYNSETN